MQTTELSIPIPADAMYGDALRIVNQELGCHARKHRRPAGRNDGRKYPEVRLLRFEPDAVVYEVEVGCDASDPPQAATDCVAEAETVNRPRSYPKCGYEADMPV